MKHLIRLRPSPAMVVACLALGIALGGTSYAAVTLPRNSVGKKQLKRNAVTGLKVKNNTLTGADVLESRLAKVPRAKAADTAALATLATTATTATTATNAITVGGNMVKRFNAGVPIGGAQVTVLDLNGFLMTLTCPGGATMLRAANSSGAAAQLRFEGQGASTGAFGGGAQAFTATSVQINMDNVGSGASHFLRLNGAGVTVHYGYRNDDFAGAGVACRVFGYAVSG
jgi:hypothetical protein